MISHRLSALGECDPPPTVKALRSYIGAVRFLSRVIKNYASLLLPLEAMIAGKPAPNTKLEWSSDQILAFKKVQAALKHTDTVVLPRPEDTLQIVTDGALQPTAIGAVLYAIRDKKPLLAGHFNSKLPTFQRRWIPCEIEGVAIGIALNHFAPYLRESKHKPIVLTDSKACVQAVQKLQRGEYSASSRLTTFLSAVSRFGVEVKHIQGSSNVLADYISRNPVPCNEVKCQICSFIKDSMESVVAAVTVEEVLSGEASLPFTNKRAWREIQEECPDLQRVFKYLANGTKPGKKGRNLRNVKRYLSSKAVLSSEGTLVVKNIEPYSQSTERIIVPQQVLHGILTVLHIRLNHPAAAQITRVFNRYFFSLNLDIAVSHVSKSCHQCAALKEVPTALKKESSDPPPDHLAQLFAADVIRRNKQMILTLRECTSSYTQAELVDSEKASDIAAALVRLSNIMRPSKLMSMTVRMDPHPSNKSLCMQVKKEKDFARNNIHIEIGRELNKNKNPVAEKCIRELIGEILKLTPEGGPLTATLLSQAVASLNSRHRASGLSSHEIFTQRDQTTGNQLSMDDQKLIYDQLVRRDINHAYSEKTKSKSPPHPSACVQPGSIVYLYDDKSKLAARPRYIVISVGKEFVKLRRFADQQLGGTTYNAKLTEIYLVPDYFADVELPPVPEDDEDDDQCCLQEVIHPVPREDAPVVTEASDVEDDLAPCSSCYQDVTEDEEALSCDTCSKWCHIICGGVTPDVYQHLLDNAEEVRWMCPTCITQASDPGTVPHTAVRPENFTQ